MIQVTAKPPTESRDSQGPWIRTWCAAIRAEKLWCRDDVMLCEPGEYEATVRVMGIPQSAK